MVKTKFDRVVKHRFHLAIRKIFLMNLLLFNGLMCKSQLSFIYNTGVFKSYNNKDIIYSKLDNRFYVLKDNSLSCFNAITNQLIYKTFSPDFIRLNYSTSFHLLTTDDKYLIAGGYPCYSVFELKTGEFVGTFNRFPNYNIKTKEFYIVGDTYDSLAATKNRIVKNVSANERSLLIKLFDPRESFVTYDYLIDTMGNITGTVRERNPAEYSYKEDFIIRYYNNLCLMIQLTDMTPFTKQFVIYDTLTKEVVRRDTLYNELYKLKLFFVNNRIIYQNHSGELILVHISDLSVETIDIDNYLVDFVSSFNENGIIFWQGANYFIHEFGKYGVTHATLKIDNLKQFRVFNIQMEVDSIYYHDNIRVHSKIDENTYIGSINYGDGHGAIHAGTTVIIDIKRNIIKPRIFSSECLVDPITSFCVGTDGLLYLNNKKLFHFSDTEIPKYIFKNISDIQEPAMSKSSSQMEEILRSFNRQNLIQKNKGEFDKKLFCAYNSPNPVNNISLENLKVDQFPTLRMMDSIRTANLDIMQIFKSLPVSNSLNYTFSLNAFPTKFVLDSIEKVTGYGIEMEGDNDRDLFGWDFITSNRSTFYKNTLSPYFPLSYNMYFKYAKFDFLRAQISLYKSDSSYITITMIDGKPFYQLNTGYYFGSKKLVKSLTALSNEKSYAFEQFDLKYNRPDKILSYLGSTDYLLIKTYEAVYFKRLKRMKITERDVEGGSIMPTVNIKNIEDLPVFVPEDSISFNLNLNGGNYKLETLIVMINGVNIYGSRGFKLEKKRKLEMTIRFPLVSGINKIEVSATNERGVESEKANYYLHCGSTTKPNLYLVTIGDSKYKDNIYDLTYAAKDAEDIKNAFQNNSLYSKVFTFTYTNEQVTTKNILKLKEELKKAKRNDVVIITVAGHGVLDKDLNYYLATYDMDFNNPREKGLPYEDLESLVDGIAPLKKVIFLDACHSGEVDKEEVEQLAMANTNTGEVKFRTAGAGIQKKNLGLKTTSELMGELFADLRRGTGATVISSAGGAEYAMESDQWKNGLFTYCLLHGLKDKAADANGDGQIMLSELQNYLRKEVTSLSNGAQQPTSRIENLSMDFRVW